MGINIQVLFDLLVCSVKIFSILLVVIKNNNHREIVAGSYSEFLVNCSWRID